MFDYETLRTLAKAVEVGTFLDAEKVLLVTQSAISHRIKALEEVVGQAVLVRSTPLRATEIGQRLITHFRCVEMMEGELREKFGSNKSEATPAKLPIALNTESLSTWFVDAVKPILKNHKVILQLYVEDQERTDQLLRAGKVIGCVTSQERTPSNCKIFYLGTMIYHLVCSPKFHKRFFEKGVNSKSLLSAPSAVYGEHDDMQYDYLKECFSGYGKGEPNRYYIPSPEVLVRFALEGIAYVLLPELSIEKKLQDGSLVDLLPEKPYRLKLYWQTYESQPEVMKELSNSILSHTRDTLTQRG